MRTADSRAGECAAGSTDGGESSQFDMGGLDHGSKPQRSSMKHFLRSPTSRHRAGPLVAIGARWRHRPSISSDHSPLPSISDRPLGHGGVGHRPMGSPAGRIHSSGVPHQVAATLRLHALGFGVPLARSTPLGAHTKATRPSRPHSRIRFRQAAAGLSFYVNLRLRSFPLAAASVLALNTKIQHRRPYIAVGALVLLLSAGYPARSPNRGPGRGRRTRSRGPRRSSRPSLPT